MNWSRSLRYDTLLLLTLQDWKKNNNTNKTSPHHSNNSLWCSNRPSITMDTAVVVWPDPCL